MSEYTCVDCTGRGGKLIRFTVYEGEEVYSFAPSACPICGQNSTIKTVGEYREQHD